MRAIVVSLFIGVLVFSMSIFVSCSQGGSSPSMEKKLEQANQKISQLKAELEKTKTDLIAADKKIEELQSTPEEKYKRLVAKSEKLNSLEDSSKLLEEIEGFIKKNPGSKTVGGARNLKGTVQKRHRELLAKKEEEASKQAVADFRKILSGIKDGFELDPKRNMEIVSLLKRSYNLGILKKLPGTSFKEAMKDPDSARGKAIKFRGSIVEVSKIEDGLFEGRLFSNFNVVTFLAIGSTEGLYAKSWATFNGVFTQLYSYPNAGGGTTHSVMLVGYFDIKANQ